MINITISNISDKPTYQQAFDKISSQIIKGELESNMMLPSIRTAAKELRISIITVKKAWEDLERQGFIYTQAGRGCFVTDLNRSNMLTKRDNFAKDKMVKDIEYYKELGLSLEDVVNLVKECYK
jgi:GntR family transcriptional regulator